jgi:hypothetical protein
MDMLMATLDALPGDDPEVEDFKRMIAKFADGLSMIDAAVKDFKK